MTASERRSSRETCICEMPTRAAISDWVSPSKNRSSTIARSRSSSAARPGLEQHAVLHLVVPRLGRSEEVLDGALVGLAEPERLRERPRRVRVVRLERLHDLLLLEPGLRGELRDRRRAAEVGRRGLDRAGELEAQLLHPARHVDGPRAVAEVALDLADDRRHGVRRELHASIDVEALDRQHEPDGADLHEILHRLAAARVTRGDLADERHELLDDLVARGRRRRRGTPLAAAEMLVRWPSSSSRRAAGGDSQLHPEPVGLVCSDTSSTSGARTRARRLVATCELAKGPTRARRPDGAASPPSSPHLRRAPA